MTIQPVTQKNPCEQSMLINSLILPAAPQANSRKRFGEREKIDPALLPAEAMTWIAELVKGGKEICGVNICGPGTPLAAPEVLFTLLDLLQKQYPDYRLKITDIGLGGSLLAKDLAAKGIAQVDLQVEAVSLDIMKKIYAWIRPGKKTVPLDKAAEFLRVEQKTAITALTDAGIQVNIQTTVYTGINDWHIADLA